jgi:beta-phosphoglucomutase family hydrolase
MKTGVIFDWDGVIIDSSEFHEKSWEKLASEEALLLPPGHFKKGFGMKNEVIIPDILHWSTDRLEINRLADRKEALYREMIAEEGLQPLPGIVEFLSILKDLNIPCAIGSSTPRLNLEVAMKHLNLEMYFDAIVSGDDVKESKPDPKVFILAAQRIGCKPEKCIVIEDAPVGIAAAHYGGMKVIGVATTHPLYTLKEADIVVQSLKELDFAKVKELLYNPGRCVS